MATAVLPDGRPIAVTGGGDATVRIWDLVTGSPIGQPLTGHTGRVGAVAAAVVLPDGRPIAVTSSWDATVRVWDLVTGRPMGSPSDAEAPPADRSRMVLGIVTRQCGDHPVARVSRPVGPEGMAGQGRVSRSMVT